MRPQGQNRRYQNNNGGQQRNNYQQNSMPQAQMMPGQGQPQMPGRQQQQPMQPMAPQGGMPQQPQPGMMQMPPQNDAEKFEQDAARLLPSVMERNPYLKEQVGQCIYDFVQKIIGVDKAPKITGMLIELPVV